MLERLIRVRDRVLGPAEERTPDKGGVFWEHAGPNCLHNAPRCYPLDMSLQTPKQLSGPTTGAKIEGGQLTESQELRKELIQVNLNLIVVSVILICDQSTTVVATKAILLGAPEEAELLSEHHEVLNLPCVGDENNKFYSTMQLNLSPAQTSDVVEAR